MKKLLLALLVILATFAITAIPAHASSDFGTFVISDTKVMGCHAVGTLNEDNSISVVGGCAILPDSAPNGGVQIFTGGTWSGDEVGGVTVCFNFVTISGPQYPNPLCVGPLPTGKPEVIPDPGGGTGTTFFDVNLDL